MNDGGRAKNPKRKAATSKADGGEAPDKKRRTTRASRAPVAPPSIDLVTTHVALNNCDVDTLASKLSSEDAEEVSWALNGLLKASADDGANYCLGLGGEKAIGALVKLFDEAIGWEESREDDEDNESNDKNLTPTSSHWDASSLSGKHQRWATFCRDKLASPLASSSDPNLLIDLETDARILETVISIMRNLSFVAQNLRFMAHSEDALRVLTGALYYRGYAVGGEGRTEGHNPSGGDVPLSSHHNNMCVHAISTFMNLSPLIDVTGRQYFIDRVLVETEDSKEVLATVPDQKPQGTEVVGYPSYGVAPYFGFGGMYLAKQYDTKAETIDAVPDTVVWDLVGSHVQATLAIFPALSAIMNPNDTTSVSTSASGWHRPSVHGLLELFTTLMENTDNKGIFLCIPDAMLHTLTDLLFLPRLGPDSLEYIDPTRNVVTRVVALKLMMGYDSSIDTDLRDRSCDLLVKLTELSPSIKRRLGMAPSISGMTCNISSDRSIDGLSSSILQTDVTSSIRRMNVRLYDSLLSMISTKSGRGDAGQLATQLLANLAVVPENRAGIMYVERKLISMASKDPHIARVACNSQIFKS
jgi:hypothetical protein